MHRPDFRIVLLGLTLGAVACGAEGGEASSGDAPTSTTTTTTAVVTEPDTLPPSSAPAPRATGGEVEGHTPADVVREWVEAVARRDTDTAWALTHTASRDLLGSPEAFETADVGIAEGYGAWASASDVAYFVVPLPAAGPAVSIVVLHGLVPMEGGSAPLADAVPVRTDADGNHQVDPFQDLLGEAGLEYQPDPGSDVPADHTFEVYLAGGRNVSLIVDDQVLRAATESSDGDRQHVTAAPAAALEPGTHRFTVVVERDGAVQARSTLYTVTR